MLEKTEIVSRVGLWLASAALTAIMMVIVFDVGSRHLFGQPVRGAYDLVSIFLLIMIFSGMASVLAQRAEILIDIVDGVVSDAISRALKVLTSVSTAGMCIYLLIAMIAPATSAYRYGDRSLELNLPVWTLWIFAFVGLGAVLIVAIARAVDDISSLGALERDDP